MIFIVVGIFTNRFRLTLKSTQLSSLDIVKFTPLCANLDTKPCLTEALAVTLHNFSHWKLNKLCYG